MQTLLALSPLIIRLLKIIVPGMIGLLLLPIIVASAVLNKSTVVWPVVAPTQVVAGQTEYLATGWTISSPFGWRPNPDNPSTWELHEGIDLAGPMFCDGCPVPPMGDIEVVFVGWDQPYASEPQYAGAGVVVDMKLQHPEEAGAVLIRYGHLQPYQVWLRTQTCTQTVDCPDYRDEASGAVTVICPGVVITTDTNGATRSYLYATPGTCRASVAWPGDFTPDGPTSLTFDQQIAPGDASSNAAITFRAQKPPPPTPTPTPTPTPLPAPSP
ncbi:MAG: M23 family metallopeptidase [Oscillochloridaceae bacterium umkhey_bin13]